MVQHKDLATVVRRVDEFLFLEDVIHWTEPKVARPPPKPRKKKDGETDGRQTTLGFGGKEDEGEE
jgi:DNA polymerase epsilon subunit 4